MYRRLNLDSVDETDALTEALLKLYAYANKYEWANEISWIKANQAIRAFAKEGNAYVVDGYLVMVDTIEPWYSYDRVLQEWLVLKLYQGGSVDSVPPALLALAKERGCKTVMSADSSPLSIVSKAYEDAGFLPLTRSYFQKVNYGSNQEMGWG